MTYVICADITLYVHKKEQTHMKAMTTISDKSPLIIRRITILEA